MRLAAPALARNTRLERSADLVRGAGGGSARNVLATVSRTRTERRVEVSLERAPLASPKVGWTAQGIPVAQQNPPGSLRGQLSGDPQGLRRTGQTRLGIFVDRGDVAPRPKSSCFDQPRIPAAPWGRPFPGAPRGTIGSGARPIVHLSKSFPVRRA